MSNDTITELVQRLLCAKAFTRSTEAEVIQESIEAITSQQAEIERLKVARDFFKKAAAEAHSAGMKAQDDRDELRAKLAATEISETQLIQERDHREEIIDQLCDAVLGTDRAEWSSAYSFEDSVEEVEVKTAVLDAEITELYALRAKLAALEGQEPYSYDYDRTMRALDIATYIVKGSNTLALSPKLFWETYGFPPCLAADPPPPEQSAKPLPPKWISVSDRPPLEGQMVLAWFYGFAFPDTAVWSSGRWALDEEFDRDYDPVKNPITHWMHLPEAPTNGIQGEST